MRNNRQPPNEKKTMKPNEHQDLAAPSASYRRRAWIQFQRTLDPLAPIKPLPPPRA